jgi:TatD DNase family protein
VLALKITIWKNDMFIDSHCHLDLLNPSGDPQDLTTIMQHAKDNQIDYLLSVSTTLETFPTILKIAEYYDHVYCSVGVHPDEQGVKDPSVEELLALAKHPKVIAIGETGLDYYRLTGDLEWQRDRFRRHIQVAKAIKKPLIIHTRNASTDTIKVMQEEKASDIGGVMHCFTENWDVAQQAMDLGFYISFSGIVTFKNALEIKEVAKKMPADRFLIETDSPFLAPIPYRGKPNEPAYVRHVAEYLAELRGVDVETIAEQCTENFWRCFRV